VDGQLIGPRSKLFHNYEKKVVGRLFLLNSDHLSHAAREFTDRFKHENPEVYKRFEASASGYFFHSKGVFAFITIYPSQEVNNMIGPGDMDVGSLRNTMRWKLISEVRLEYLGDMNKNIIRDIIAFVCILLFVTTIGLYLLLKEKNLTSHVRQGD
jgi:hypothetical protein